MIFVSVLFIVGLSIDSYAQEHSQKPVSQLIQLDRWSPDSAQILGGPPQTFTMRSGYMVLPPHKSVGRHSTKTYEESLVILAGEGEFKIRGGTTLHLHPYCVVYCPPNTEHDVTNTGTDTMRYVYIVAKAK